MREGLKKTGKIALYIITPTVILIIVLFCIWAYKKYKKKKEKEVLLPEEKAIVKEAVKTHVNVEVSENGNSEKEVKALPEGTDKKVGIEKPSGAAKEKPNEVLPETKKPDETTTGENPADKETLNEK